MDREDVVDNTHTHTHTHTMEYYLAIRKNQILPFIVMWIGLEGIILSEIIQTETNIIYYYLHVESNTATSQ